MGRVEGSWRYPGSGWAALGLLEESSFLVRVAFNQAQQEKGLWGREGRESLALLTKPIHISDRSLVEEERRRIGWIMNSL